MAERTVFDCDRCGAKSVEVQRYSVTIDRVADGAGGMENKQECVDLCHACSAKELRMMLHKLSYEDSALWVEDVRDVLRRKVK